MREVVDNSTPGQETTTPPTAFDQWRRLSEIPTNNVIIPGEQKAATTKDALLPMHGDYLLLVSDQDGTAPVWVSSVGERAILVNLRQAIQQKKHGATNVTYEIMALEGGSELRFDDRVNGHKNGPEDSVAFRQELITVNGEPANVIRVSNSGQELLVAEINKPHPDSLDSLRIMGYNELWPTVQSAANDIANFISTGNFESLTDGTKPISGVTLDKGTLLDKKDWVGRLTISANQQTS